MEKDNEEYEHRLNKLARQILGALNVFPGEFSCSRHEFVEDLRKIVGKKFCLLCFRKFVGNKQKCYCDPIYDE